jgi:N-acetylmuramoyl-L-alanine amidase
MPSFTPADLDTLARTLWGEARGESFEGKIAVAWVVRNRAERGGWWGKTVRDVCLKPLQFSAWNPSDPNRAKMATLTIADTSFRECLSAAAAVLGDVAPDMTNGSTNYHALSVNPEWAAKLTPTTTIGNHIFYKEAA